VSIEGEAASVPGAKGARVRPGEKGAAGTHVVAMNPTGYTLVLELSNGQMIRCNLLPAFERFARESDP